MASAQAFNVVETTIARHPRGVQGRHADRAAACADVSRPHRRLRQERARRSIPSSRSIPTRLEEADRLDAAFKTSGFVGPLHGIPVIMKDQADIKGMPTTLGLGAVQGLHARPRLLRRRQAEKGRRHFHRQGDIGRARRRRHARLVVRIDPQRLRSGADGGRLLGRLGRQRLRQFLHRRGRAGGLRIDPPAVDLERRRRHAPDDGTGQPGRRLWRLAHHQRLARTDGANGHRRWRSCSTAWSATTPTIR